MKIIKANHSFFLALVLLSFFSGIAAQDIIYTTDGRKFEVEVVESDGTVVKYREYNNPQSPVRTFDVTYLDMIQHEDGTIERFLKKETNKSIIELSPKDNTLELLNRKYERNRAVAKTSEYLGWTALGCLVVGLIVSDGSDFWDDWFRYSGITTLAIIPVNSFFVWRTNYFHKRIQSLSFIVTPNTQLYAQQSIDFRPTSVSVGFSLTF